MNLNQIQTPANADEAMEWAAQREFGLRYDAYREAEVREVGTRALFVCHSPEAQWITYMQQHSVKV